MDPVTLLASATAAYNGLKKVVEYGKEAEHVFSQLGKWAKAASDLREYIDEKEIKKPGIFETIGFKRSDTTEAFNIFMARQKLIDMEQEIYGMFLYGGLQHLGTDGYREFTKIKKEIRLKREQMILDQVKRRKKFAEAVFTFIMICTTLFLLSSLIGVIIAIVSNSANASQLNVYL